MAFLFGSFASGKSIPESDVDVAVWFKGAYFLKDINQIAFDLNDLLKREIDVLPLNQARPTVAWAAMRGKPIIIRDYRLYFSKLIEISIEAEDMQDFVIDLFKLRQEARIEASK